MDQSIAGIFTRLKPDLWRTNVGFSPDLQDCQEILFRELGNGEACELALSQWLQKHQPCLFGRIAAKLGLISYCFLSERDLLGGDDAIQKKIQDARRSWTRRGFEGKKSAFIILVISRTIANCLPCRDLETLARRLCSLYLLQDVHSDEICTDSIYLELPRYDRATLRWDVGVNYFCSNGDKRWWHDHRIPGGMGFSMNSVGHLVKSGIVANHLAELDELLGGETERLAVRKVDSLEKALELAMRTIWLATETSSGKATWLTNIDKPSASKCPVELPAFLSNRNFCEYEGYYHTDYTVPSEYFRPDVERPDRQRQFTLDFTYLFDRSVENTDHLTAGTGLQIRSVGSRIADAKVYRGLPQTVRIEDSPRLLEALRNSRE